MAVRGSRFLAMLGDCEGENSLVVPTCIPSGIYAVLNLLNGKRYIGSAVNLEGRRRCHFRALRRGNHHNIYLQRAFRKCGESAFGWIILEYIEDAGILESRENLYLKMFPSRLKYNMCPAAGSSLGRECTEETRRKMRDAKMGERNHMYGKCHSDETKQLLHDVHKGKQSGEQNPFYGRHHTTEVKQRLKKASLEWWANPEHLRAVLNSNPALQSGAQNFNYGKSRSAKIKQKISEGMKRSWARRKRQQLDIDNQGSRQCLS